VAKTADGWTARLRIPWQGLGVSAPAAGDVWGVNFIRMDQPGKADHDRMQMSSWVKLPIRGATRVPWRASALPGGAAAPRRSL
jgi:hypothetical protein